jgi:hypothetical protein
MCLSIPAFSSAAPASSAIVEHRVFWNRTINDLAMVAVCTDTAGMATFDGDLIRAARLLGDAQRFANGAATAMHAQMPGDWHDSVGTHLARAQSALAVAGIAVRRYLARSKVADLKAAQSAQSRATVELAAASAAAKSAYVAIGGNPHDLETVGHALQGASNTLTTTMDDTDTDDQ